MKSVADAIRDLSEPCFCCKALRYRRMLRRPVGGMWQGKPRTTICAICTNCSNVIVRGIPEVNTHEISVATGLSVINVTDGEWENIEKQYEKYCEDRREQYRRDAEDEKSQRANDYKAYLLTKDWADRRTAVFQRDNYLCQGCRINRAVQVHHLTYKNIFREPLFDLVAICKSCHDQLHADRDMR